MARVPQPIVIAGSVLLIVLFVWAVVLVVQSVNRPVEIGQEVCDLKDNDGDGQIDEGFAITCTKDAECGPSSTYGETYCKDGDVWQAALRQFCTVEPGTCLSECASVQEEQLIKSCRTDCLDGHCVEA